MKKGWTCACFWSTRGEGVAVQTWILSTDGKWGRQNSKGDRREHGSQRTPPHPVPSIPRLLPFLLSSPWLVGGESRNDLVLKYCFVIETLLAHVVRCFLSICALTPRAEDTWGPPPAPGAALLPLLPSRLAPAGSGVPRLPLPASLAPAQPLSVSWWLGKTSGLLESAPHSSLCHTHCLVAQSWRLWTGHPTSPRHLLSWARPPVKEQRTAQLNGPVSGDAFSHRPLTLKTESGLFPNF